jgi:uncharacterized protein (TIGR03000 family)
MYSVVLMAALTTAPEAPGCWLKHGGHGCHGCYGGCHGCGWGCGGCHGCNGCYGCYGGYGGCWDRLWGYPWNPSPWNSWSGVYGGYGFYGCGGACFGTPYAPKPTPPPAKPAELIPPPEKKEEEKKEAAPAAAKLIIDLPENAKLFVDNQPIQATGSRSFNTPKLLPGQAYYYIVKVELVRDGKTYADTKQVIVRAGQTSRADFLALGKTDPDKALARAGE